MSRFDCDVADVLDADRRHVWHPYSALPGVVPPLPVVSARGVRLRLADGRELIDGMASWWCAVHGYQHPSLDEAIREQLSRMAHVMFGGLTHEPAVRLASRLVDVHQRRSSMCFSQIRVPCQSRLRSRCACNIGGRGKSRSDGGC